MNETLPLALYQPPCPSPSRPPPKKERFWVFPKTDIRPRDVMPLPSGGQTSVLGMANLHTPQGTHDTEFIFLEFEQIL